ncbi:MAG: hypothetical protein KAW02_00765 [candidate division Zixibacteria bacterium]|nr:hypothetical protein [candidate division Zixibacteria bacterium]
MKEERLRGLFKAIWSKPKLGTGFALSTEKEEVIDSQRATGVVRMKTFTVED